MKVEIFETPAQVTQRAAEQLIQQIQQKPNSVLGLATGQSQIEVYLAVVRAYQMGQFSAQDLITFNLDEYVGVPAQHPSSYRAYMETHLFSQLNFRVENIHFLNGMASNLQAECERYESLLHQHEPRDFQLLGLGRDGHIGFNEPHTPFSSLTHVQELDPRTREDNQKHFANPKEMPQKALTMGIQSLMKALHIVLVAFGESKAWAVREMLEGAQGPHLPATALRDHPNVHIILDKKAAQGLA